MVGRKPALGSVPALHAGVFPSGESQTVNGAKGGRVRLVDTFLKNRTSLKLGFHLSPFTTNNPNTVFLILEIDQLLFVQVKPKQL